MNEEVARELQRRYGAPSAEAFGSRLCTPIVQCLVVLAGSAAVLAAVPTAGLAVMSFLPTTTSTTTTTTMTTRTATTTTTTTTTATTATSTSTTSSTRTRSTTTETATASATTTSATTATRTTATRTVTVASTSTTGAPSSSSTSAARTSTTAGVGAGAGSAESGAAAPAALQAGFGGSRLASLSLLMTVQNIGFTDLKANDLLSSLFEAQVQGAIAAQAGHGISPRRVHLELAEGSVMVKATVSPLSADVAKRLEVGLNGSAALGHRVAASVQAVQGLQTIATGPITVVNIGTASVLMPDRGLREFGSGAGFAGSLASGPWPLRQPSKALAAAACGLGVVLLGVCCLSVASCRGRGSAKDAEVGPCVCAALEGPDDSGRALLLAPGDEEEVLLGRRPTLRPLSPQPPPAGASTREAAASPNGKAAAEAVQAAPVPAQEPPPKAKKAPEPAPSEGHKAAPKASPKAKKVPGHGYKATREDARAEVLLTQPLVASRGSSRGRPQEQLNEANAKKAGALTKLPSGLDFGSEDKEAKAKFEMFVGLAGDMDFSEEQAGAALAEAGGNTEKALQRLLSLP